MDAFILEAAIEGLQTRREKITERMREIRSALGERGAVAPLDRPTGRRPMSAAARKRISAAQKKRWAEYHRRSA